MRSKDRVFRVHFNRIATQRGDPLVWSVQLSDRCLHGHTVQFMGLFRLSNPLTTEYKPNSKHNPRAFFKGKGWVQQRGGYITIYGA